MAIPEYLAVVALLSNTNSELIKAVGNLALIVFYHLLRVSKYTFKNKQKDTKQTQQFKMEDVTFFKTNAMGQLRQLLIKAVDKDICSAISATLKLDNQ